MDEQALQETGQVEPVNAAGGDIRTVVRSVIEEVLSRESQKAEPAYKAELVEERKRRETLERRVNELVQENERSRKVAEETDRHSQIRAELQRLGVAKVDLAFKVVKDEVVRAADGSLAARTVEGEQNLRQYLSSFVHQNPEFLPARIAGGSGVSSPPRSQAGGATIELERIHPGMSKEDLQRVREQISQVALQSLRGE